MPRDREELAKQLIAKAEEAIHKMLDDLPDKSALKMADMGKLIGDMGHERMQEVAQSQQVELSQVMCEACQVQMHKRGKRKKRVVTRRGEIQLERQYYVCPQCGRGVFPPG
jgi:YgiT-type zinc finger domain-containing protein